MTTARPPRSAARAALYALVAEVSRSIPDRNAQAAAVGVTLSQLYKLRCKAKAAGYDVAPIANLGQFATRYTDAFARIDREMAGPGCPRCGLHGSHVCTDRGLVDLVESRISRWVEPAPGYGGRLERDAPPPPDGGPCPSP